MVDPGVHGPVAGGFTRIPYSLSGSSAVERESFFA